MIKYVYMTVIFLFEKRRRPHFIQVPTYDEYRMGLFNERGVYLNYS